MRTPNRLLLAVSVVLCPLSTAVAEPLHQRIDALIAAAPQFPKQPAAPTSDAEFLRRIHLDLVGSIPTSEEVRTFLNDASADKRAKLIDRLLASPEHARHLANVLNVTLMERRPSKNVPEAQWLEYLRTSVVENKPWDVLVREILSADGSDPKTRPAAKFYLDRDGEPHLITRDVGRLFLGLNLQCAQCHDHPLIDDYKQQMYYGLFAFFNRSSLFTDRTSKQAVMAEKADGEVTYQSVFDPQKLTKQTGPRLLASAPIQEPTFEKGKEYEVAPAANVRPVPKFSRRAQLAPLLTATDTVAFRRNAVNRFWAMMMGRGIVHPLDLEHALNPPSHPELLDLLADEFAVSKYDIRALLRELALSQTYQRSSERPADLEGSARSFAVAELKPLTPEQFAWAMMQATGLTDAERKALGTKANEAALHARLGGNVGAFVSLFGGRAGEPENDSFQATLDQALFLRNGGVVRGWLTQRSGNLLDRLAALPEVGSLTEELYLSVLTRKPSADEVREVEEYLNGRTDRPTALAELAWALLASAEFRFNH